VITGGTYGGANDTPTLQPPLLTANLTYTATVTTGVKDLAGNALASNLSWSFTTAAVVDNTPPTVTAMYPANGATNIGVNEMMTATFSKAMDPQTLTTQTFTVQETGNPAQVGTVTYVTNGSIATFTPSSPLNDNTTYTATVTTGAKDLAANALASNQVWTFTTGQSLPSLGRAGSFALMATGTITGTCCSTINGDVGVNPNGPIALTGATVNGSQHTNDQAIINAQADLLNTYNALVAKATNRVTLSTLELGNRTLPPGLYTSGSTYNITNVDLTLDAGGNPNAVFIFQMGSALTVNAGRKINLINMAKAGNVYWQVGSSATITSTVATPTTFNGNILAVNSITVDTGSIVVGRLLGGTGPGGAGSVTFDNSTISLPQ